MTKTKRKRVGLISALRNGRSWLFKIILVGIDRNWYGLILEVRGFEFLVFECHSKVLRA